VTRAAQPHDAFIAAIRDAGRPIGGRELHRAIREAGQPESSWRAWASGLKDLIVLHPRIRVTGKGASKRYRWAAPVSAEEALSRLSQRVKAPKWLREAWREVVSAALARKRSAAKAGSVVNRRLRQAQELQAGIGAARAAAEVAIEVEEIAHNGADPAQIVKRVRNALARKDLTPIGAAGEDTAFDPGVHRLDFGDPRPGTPVFILRPGYHWRRDGEVMVIEHALVVKA
jgi:hypothetical protein